MGVGNRVASPVCGASNGVILLKMYINQLFNVYDTGNYYIGFAILSAEAEKQAVRLVFGNIDTGGHR
jgi:hypothetical protein